MGRGIYESHVPLPISVSLDACLLAIKARHGISRSYEGGSKSNDSDVIYFDYAKKNLNCWLHSLEVLPSYLYAAFHPLPTLQETVTVLRSRYTSQLWMDCFRQFLDTRKLLPSDHRFNFRKQPKVTGSRVRWVGWMGEKGDPLLLQVLHSEASFAGCSIVVVQQKAESAAG